MLSGWSSSSSQTSASCLTLQSPVVVGLLCLHHHLSGSWVSGGLRELLQGTVVAVCRQRGTGPRV